MTAARSPRTKAMSKRIFPSIGYSRLRMGCDGEGVTTLVCAQGCPLRCKYCLNPQSSLKKTAPRHVFTPEGLRNALKIDSLYFQATGGGVTFGGGEPLLYAEFIGEFARLVKPSGWRIFIESSLSVSRERVRLSVGYTDFYIIDIKDTDPEIYKAYTGRDIDRALSNLEWLISAVGSQKIRVRLPLIPGFNTDAHRDRSEKLLRDMGVTDIERFDYIIKDKLKEKDQ